MEGHGGRGAPASSETTIRDGEDLARWMLSDEAIVRIPVDAFTRFNGAFAVHCAQFGIPSGRLKLRNGRQACASRLEPRRPATPAVGRCSWGSVSPLTRSALPRLSLRASGVTDAHVTAIARTIRQVPIVRSLDLRENGLRDECLWELLSTMRWQLECAAMRLTIDNTVCLVCYDLVEYVTATANLGRCRGCGSVGHREYYRLCSLLLEDDNEGRQGNYFGIPILKRIRRCESLLRRSNVRLTALHLAKLVDEDGDGRISISEFRGMLGKNKVRAFAPSPPLAPAVAVASPMTAAGAHRSTSLGMWRELSSSPPPGAIFRRWACKSRTLCSSWSGSARSWCARRG